MNVSLNPRDFVQSGLIDDQDVEVLDARFIATDYDGSLPSATALALQVKFRVLGDDSFTEHDHLFSAGSVADFAPDPDTDGRTLIQNGTRSNLSKNSNLGLFLQSMVDHGANLDPLTDGDVSVLIGAKIHIKRVPAPKRDGLVSSASTRPDGREREKTILVCSKIISLPWDRKGKTAPAAAGKADNRTEKATAYDSKDDYSVELLASAVSWISEDLQANGKSPIRQLRLRGMRQVKNFGLKPGKESNQFLDHICDPAFLKENGFNVTGEDVSL